MQGHLTKSSSRPVLKRLHLQQCGVNSNKAQLGNHTKTSSGPLPKVGSSPAHSKQGSLQVQHQQRIYPDHWVAGAAFLALLTIAIAVATTQLGAEILLLAPWMSPSWTVYGDEGAFCCIAD